MIPVFDVSRAVGWLKTAAADTIKFIALKALLVALVFTVLPIALYKGWLLVQEKLFAYLSANMGDTWTGTMVPLTGLGAWIADNLRFQECFMVLASALSVRFILGFFRR